MIAALIFELQQGSTIPRILKVYSVEQVQEKFPSGIIHNSKFGSSTMLARGNIGMNFLQMPFDLFCNVKKPRQSFSKGQSQVIRIVNVLCSFLSTNIGTYSVTECLRCIDAPEFYELFLYWVIVYSGVAHLSSLKMNCHTVSVR